MFLIPAKLREFRQTAAQRPASHHPPGHVTVRHVSKSAGGAHR